MARLIALCAVLSGCAALSDVVYPPGPPVPQDAGTAGECAAACDNLARMQCPGWQGSPGPDEAYGTVDDVACATACVDIVTSDPTMTLHQRCTAAATSCEGVDACFGEG